MSRAAPPAMLAQVLGADRVFVFDDASPYGSGVAASFSHAAARLGLNVAGGGRWDDNQASYQSQVPEEWGGPPRSIGIARRTHGVLSSGPDEGLELLRGSVVLLEDSPPRLEFAYSLVALGSLLGVAAAVRPARPSSAGWTRQDAAGRRSSPRTPATNSERRTRGRAATCSPAPTPSPRASAASQTWPRAD